MLAASVAAQYLMSDHYRNKLFTSYHATHIAHLDADESAKEEFFSNYATSNYVPLLSSLDRDATRVLEIGCNRGYLLRALSRLGFSNLHGVDLSPDDVAHAKTTFPTADIVCEDVFDYLKRKPDTFDVIITKAVLEHVPKPEILPLVNAIFGSLRPDGRVIVDVPNMDWVFAPHERYMDFTHEVGFTRESLGQVLRNVFPSVTLHPGAAPVEAGLKGHVIAALRPAVIALGQIIFRIIGEGASDTWWHCRSIIAVGKK